MFNLRFLFSPTSPVFTEEGKPLADQGELHEYQILTYSYFYLSFSNDLLL